MITPERISRASRLRWERMNPGIPWEHVKQERRAEMEASIARTAEDLFPELVPGPDGISRAWIAPWEATRSIALAIEGEAGIDWLAAMATWQAARDAHLKDTTTP